MCFASVSGDMAALPRGTPLYGQPSWWGDGDADDENSFKQESKSSSKKHDAAGKKQTASGTSMTQMDTEAVVIKRSRW